MEIGAPEFRVRLVNIVRYCAFKNIKRPGQSLSLASTAESIGPYLPSSLFNVIFKDLFLIVCACVHTCVHACECACACGYVHMT